MMISTYTKLSRNFLGKSISFLTATCLVSTPLIAQEGSTEEDSPELTAKASQAIDKGLKYLLATQKEDGSWDEGGEGNRVIGITSLAMMAFMAKAQFPGSGPYGKELDRAKDFLLDYAKSSTDGYLGSTMYEHGLATLALSEIWGMTRDNEDDEVIQNALEKAVDVIIRSQNPGGGWRYQPQADGGEDTSCTQTVFHALASARQAGILVPEETITKVGKYLRGAQSAESGGFTYAPNGKANVSFACTAGGTYSAQLAGLRDSEMVGASLRYMMQQFPEVITKGDGHYFYGHYYAIQAMVQAGDEYYAEWYPVIRDALISRQMEDGSWNKGRGEGQHSTPMAIIILATPHRYIPIYQR